MSKENERKIPQKPQKPKGQPIHKHAEYGQRSTPSGRTTTTNSAPSPGHKK